MCTVRPSPPPIVRVLRLIGVCCGSHHLHALFASRIRWACAVAATSVLRSCLVSVGVCYAPSPVVSISLSVGCAMPARTSTRRLRLEFAGCVAPTTSRSRLAFNDVLCQPPPLLVVRVLRSTKVRSHHCLSSNESVPATVFAFGERGPLRLYSISCLLLA